MGSSFASSTSLEVAGLPLRAGTERATDPVLIFSWMNKENKRKCGFREVSIRLTT
jgi:hypothetical protein